MCQEASGLEGTEWVLGLEGRATERAVSRLDAMVARRLAGEPLQYVLGRWSFRTPRPAGRPARAHPPARDGAARRGRRSHSPGRRPRPLTIADLGTGSGAIALALAAELSRRPLTVWATDASEDALDVARANLAGIGPGRGATSASPPARGSTRCRPTWPAPRSRRQQPAVHRRRPTTRRARRRVGADRRPARRPRRPRRRCARSSPGRRAGCAPADGSCCEIGASAGSRGPCPAEAAGLTAHASSPTSPATTASSSRPCRRRGRRHLGCRLGRTQPRSRPT